MNKQLCLLLIFCSTILVLSCTTIHQKNSQKQQVQSAHKGRRIVVEKLPDIEGSQAATPIQLAAFSTLALEELTAQNWLLTTLTDRGPNANSSNQQRPFAAPQFVPSIIMVNFNPQTNRAQFLKRIPFTLPNGKNVTGLPNVVKEEMPINLQNQTLLPDPNGLDTEGLVKAQDGSYWVCEEYGPSIVHFSSSGEWLARFVPHGKLIPGMIKTKDLLPKELADRQTNRGFEGVALAGKLLYAFMQSPHKKKSQTVRIIEFDIYRERVIGEYAYIMPDSGVDKIGDVQALGNGQFLIIELDSLMGATSQKFLKILDLKNASNLHLNEHSKKISKLLKKTGQTLEDLSAVDLEALEIKAAASKKVANLILAGFNYSSKAEGLAIAKDRQTVLVVNDNDFNLTGEYDPVSKILGLKNEPTEILKFKLSQPIAVSNTPITEAKTEAKHD